MKIIFEENDGVKVKIKDDIGTYSCKGVERNDNIFKIPLQKLVGSIDEPLKKAINDMAFELNNFKNRK